jgi:hypothetical protein
MKFRIFTIITVLVVLIACHHNSGTKDTSSTVNNCCANPSKDYCAGNHSKSCNSTSASISGKGIKVLYFHNQRRCATCIAIEEGAAEVVKLLGDSSVTFHSFLIGNPNSLKLEKEYDIQGQSLLIIGKDQVLDITNMAFLNALVKPEYYKGEVKKQIEKLK